MICAEIVGEEVKDADEYARSQKSKFRFKSSKRKLSHGEDQTSSSRHDGRRRKRHQYNKRRKASEPPDSSGLYDDTYVPDMDPDAAFRESLFDAMADDEGAQFWEGVYGQPIPKMPPLKETSTGGLEAMTEDEYAAHVRAEMYKKTHQYLFEEKARREDAEKESGRLKEQARREEEEADRFRRMVDQSLKRGKERRDKTQWHSKWAIKWRDYEKSWAALGDRPRSGPAKIPWPVWGGTSADIGKEAVEDFFLNGPTSGKPIEADLLKTLKPERLRWHPDKMQQKLGGQEADGASMRAVTAVFQIIDRIWTEARNKKS